LGKEFQKKYPIGDQKRDGYDKLYMECENALYNQKVLLDWDKIVDDTPVKNVFDPLLVKLNQCKGILTAGLSPPVIDYQNNRLLPTYVGNSACLKT